MGRRDKAYKHAFGEYDRLPLALIDGTWKCCYLLPCRRCVRPCLEECLYHCVCKYAVKGVLCCPCYCYCCYEDSLCGNGKGTKKKKKKKKKGEKGQKGENEEVVSAQPQVMERDEAPVLLPMLSLEAASVR